MHTSKLVSNAFQPRSTLCLDMMPSTLPSSISTRKTHTHNALLLPCTYYSLCNTTMIPIIPSMTCFSHGCSLSRIVTYPTKGINPTTLPMTSSLRLRKDWPAAYSSVSSARLLSPFVRRRRGVLLSSTRVLVYIYIYIYMPDPHKKREHEQLTLHHISAPHDAQWESPCP